MSREFDPKEVEQLIKECFRLAPKNYFRDNQNFPTDIQSAINFAKNAADNRESIANEREPNAHYSRMLAAITTGLLARETGVLPSDCIVSAIAALGRKGIKP